MADDEDEDICRVCRSNASPDKPLFHPCICTGSIRHVHQDCLVQWLRHSRKEYCELCKHKYTFTPIYSPDMPRRLPLSDLFIGLARSIGSAVKCWIHYTLVAIAWLGVVPLTASRIYNCIFAGSVNVLLSLPKDMLSTKNIGTDILHGCVVVACSLTAFICLVWLRVQILKGEMPAWLLPRPDEQPAQHVNVQAPIQQQNIVNEGEDNVNDDEMEVGGNDNVDDNNNANAQVEDEVPQNNVPVLPQNNAPADNINWNAPIEWDGRAEDPTWERILGLDGSLLFLEHVFWVIALNTLFILVFAFCPYHLGHFFTVSVDLNSYIVATRFEGVLTALCGYVLVACGFLSCHLMLQIAKFHWPGWIFGICYVILKVGLLVLIEIGAFPLVCGVWLDVCTLKVFNSTLQSRRESYLSAPGTSIFFHWLVGMVFVFYFATFLMLLREVLRPGALWFLRNLNDPDFNPINEMIHLPIYRLCRRFMLSVVIFGSTIIVIAWLPVRLLQFIAPNFLPYNGTNHSSSPVGEFPLQLMVLQFILPGLLEQGHTRVWMKAVVQWWAKIIGSLLGVRSYLLGDEQVVPGAEENNQQQQHNDVAEVHAENRPAEPRPALHPAPIVVNQHEWNINQPYTRPSCFTLRIILLLICMAGTFTIISSAILLLPVFIGRTVFSFLFGTKGLVSSSGETDLVMHELYTFAVGLYLCWSCIRLASLSSIWAPRGWRIIQEKITDGLLICMKASVLGIFVFGLIPLILGILFDLVIVVPLRVPLHQTPVIFLWQDWALGILLLKLSIASLLLGPNTWLKADIEAVYQQGFRRMNLVQVLRKTVAPVVIRLLTSLAGPYAFGHLIPLLFDVSHKTMHIFHWRTHPLVIISTMVIGFCVFEFKQFCRLCDHIKNERYLIGKRLLDYDPPSTTS